MTQRLYHGRSWRNSPIAKEMFECFWRINIFHQLIASIILIEKNFADGELTTKKMELEALCEYSPEELVKVNISSVKQTTLSLLRRTASAAAIPLNHTWL